MSGILNDQAAAHRLAERIEGRFAYVPAYAGWFRRSDMAPAEALVREELVDLLSECEGGSGQQYYERVRQSLASAQKAVLWILERDTRLLAEPEVIEQTPAASGAPWQPTEEFFALCRAYFPQTPQKLMSFSTHARMRSGTGPRLFLRSLRQAVDPDDLFPVLSADWGGRVVRLPFKVWKDWPTGLTPEWVHRLWGVWIVFLDAPESNPRTVFPQEALLRLFRPWQEWQGHDGLFRRLPMPTHYVLGGPPQNSQNWRAELFALVLEARPIFRNGEEACDL